MYVSESSTLLHEQPVALNTDAGSAAVGLRSNQQELGWVIQIARTGNRDERVSAYSEVRAPVSGFSTQSELSVTSARPNSSQH